MKRRPIALASNEAMLLIKQLAERSLSGEEFDAYIHASMSDAERQDILDSVEWFNKRYPTPAARLAAARRAYSQWRRNS